MKPSKNIRWPRLTRAGCANFSSLKRKKNEKRAYGPTSKIEAEDLPRIYHKLRKTFGHQSWWPAETPFEVMIGAILTQNTSWTNVEKAIANLRKAGLLSFSKMKKLSHGQLARMIRPAGYYNVKADRIRSFLRFFQLEYQGSVLKMRREDLPTAREKLLRVKGIAPETADSILLYALGKPTFVIDAYTKRIFSRHRLAKADNSYDEWKGIFEKALPAKTPLFNDYHAQIVRLAKEFCRTRPRCEGCPLRDAA